MCSHRSSCPSVQADTAHVVMAHVPPAHVVAAHPEQGWSLLCDGSIVFDDSGVLLPDGSVVAPHRLQAARLAQAA
ncbi:DUF5999 family protein [Streptomyces sp. FB2]|uniref:DUF5999 family protein n=1 Tax=Streptomyces sp. FB2 TaxID=2902454 RepID=UPI001F3FE9E3|nr:DUF5999 family protein [Streptomyces sp. FB2]MCF2535750.1 DUF5999 family protein [Streptomyces sp. FB2]